MEREISIILKVKGAAAAKKSVEDVFNQTTLNSVVKFTTQTTKAGNATEKLGRQAKGAGNNVMSFTKALGRGMAALYLYNRAWNTFGTQFESGLNLQRASEQFEMNVGSVNKMLPELQSATRGVIADFDLLKTATRAFQQGIKPQQMAATFKMGTIAAQRLGLEASDAINTITQAITRQDEGALNTLGIITNVNQAYKTQTALIAKNGGAMSKAMAIQLRQSLIMKELQNRFGGANKVQDDGLAVLERFRASWTNFRAEIGKTIGIALVPLTRAITGLLDVVTGLLKRLNETGGFQKIVQITATFAGIIGGMKFIAGAKSLMSLLGFIGSAKGGMKVPVVLTKINRLVTALGAVALKALPKVRTLLGAIAVVAPRLGGLFALVPGWGTAIFAVTTLLGPLVKLFGKAWTAGKVFFQLLNNLDEESGMSKVLRKDADELGSMYNLIENLAKITLEGMAVIRGVGRGIADTFSPIGTVLSWAGDQLGKFGDWLFKVDKIAVRSSSRMDMITEKWARWTKYIGLAASGIALLLPGLQAVGVAGVVGFGGAILNDMGAGQAITNALNEPIQRLPKNNGPVVPQNPQTSTQMSMPTPRAMNTDIPNDSSELLIKINRILEKQTGIMESDSQKQDIRESQNSVRNNIYRR